MQELHIIDFIRFKSKSGKDCRMVSLWYKNRLGYCSAGNFFIPDDYDGPDPKPGIVMHGKTYRVNGKEVLIALDK